MAMNQQLVEILKEEIVEIGKKAVDLKYVTTVGGNICVRIPFSESQFLITATSMPLDELDKDGILLIDANGHILETDLKPSLKPSKETQMHLSILKVRPDVGSTVHLHPLISTTLATLDESITPVTSEELFFIGDKVGVVPLLPAGSTSLQEAVLSQAKECNVIILKNHGCVALGKNLKEAFYRVVKLERAAQATVIAKIFGRKIDPFPLLG